MVADEGTAPAKIGAMLVLGCTALACTLAPLLAVRKYRRLGSSQGLLRFGGGVLLATTFLHLLPELGESMEGLDLPQLPVKIPELLMCTGFFMMYLIEEVTHSLIGKNHNEVEDQNQFYIDSEKKRLCNDHDLNQMWMQSTPLRAIMITVSISIHQVFEGLAVGLEGHSNQVWILTGAIAAHKAVIALCIGAELSRSPFWSAVPLVTMFTLATPFGIALGLLLSESSSFGLSSFILQGLAAGTLLFVVFFEVLRPEGKTSFSNYIFTLLGFITMFILLCFFES